jgi:hypothetical protein
MVIFNSYVKLPEGKFINGNITNWNDDGTKKSNKTVRFQSVRNDGMEWARYQGIQGPAAVEL